MIIKKLTITITKMILITRISLASTVKKEIRRCFTQNASNFLLMIPPASVKPKRAFSPFRQLAFSKLRSLVSDAVL